MADFRGTTTVDASADALFDFLSDVRNLPRYFARMTSAEPGEGDEVHTTATLPDSTKVEGDAWFKVDTSARHLSWGAEGSNDYNGYLDVREAGSGVGSEVEVHLHTNHVPEDSPEMSEGIDRTLSTIKLLVEKQGVIA